MPEGVGFVEGTGVLALYFAKGENALWTIHGTINPLLMV